MSVAPRRLRTYTDASPSVCCPFSATGYYFPTTVKAALLPSKMDLSALNSTLPPGLADGEREMGDKFRGKFRSSRPVNSTGRVSNPAAAALSITTLYKTSLANTKVRPNHT